MSAGACRTGDRQARLDGCRRHRRWSNPRRRCRRPSRRNAVIAKTNSQFVRENWTRYDHRPYTDDSATQSGTAASSPDSTWSFADMWTTHDVHLSSSQEGMKQLMGNIVRRSRWPIESLGNCVVEHGRNEVTGTSGEWWTNNNIDILQSHDITEMILMRGGKPTSN